ncbi:MAG: HNH endonuclease [Desulfobacterales bacterium]|nr:HNH endonuclease [Desulfobacterales bacterium]
MINKIYTSEQLRYLRRYYPKNSQRELTELFNQRFIEDKTENQIKSCLGNHKITSGRTGCFEKGNIPWNTGIKGLTTANRTSFKKGNVPQNRKPLWSERISKDGYIEMKVPERNPYTGSPTCYKLKHVWIWEQEHGPVPEGYVVAFMDSNNRNFDPENLILLTRNELLHINHHDYKNQPDALKPSVLSLARLEAKAGFRTDGKRRRRRVKRF